MADDGLLELEEVAALTGMTPRGVRAWVTRGLVPPPDRVGRRVRYRQEHLARVRLVQALQARGHTLGAIRQVLDGDANLDELERLAARQADPPADGSSLIPLARDGQEAAEAAHPGVVEELADLGVLLRGGPTGYLAEGALLAATRRMAAAGVPLADVAQLARASAHAADALLDHCRTQLASVDDDRREECLAAAVRTASWAFEESLRRRLTP